MADQVIAAMTEDMNKKGGASNQVAPAINLIDNNRQINAPWGAVDAKSAAEFYGMEVPKGDGGDAPQ